MPHRKVGLRARSRGHGDPVNAVAFSPDGRRVVSGSSDATLRLCEMEGGGPRPSSRAIGWVTLVCFCIGAAPGAPSVPVDLIR
jgi:WD40 repeat protein